MMAASLLFAILVYVAGHLVVDALVVLWAMAAVANAVES